MPRGDVDYYENGDEIHFANNVVYILERRGMNYAPS